MALLPIDGSQHVLSYAQVEEVSSRLKAKLIVPHHYYVWDVLTRGSTLLPPDEGVNGRPGSIWTDGPSIRLDRAFVQEHESTAVCFGTHVAFEKPDPRMASTGA